MTTGRGRTGRKRTRLTENERDALKDEIENITAQHQGLTIADRRAIAETADQTLRYVAGTTLAQAAGAIALCDILTPLLLRSGNPYAVAAAAALKAGCRIRRVIRGRT